MKKISFSLLMAFAMISLSLFTTSCQKEKVAANPVLKTGTVDWRSNNNVLYPPTAHPFGKSYLEWIETATSRAYSFDCATMPFGNDLNQNDPNVFFLGAGFGTETINVTVPKDKAIWSGVVVYFNTWPCPDPSFQPAPGQTLEDFLQEGATAFVDGFQNIQVTLDGNVLDLTDYRFETNLFNITGTPELVNCFDGCITGDPQPIAVNGYHLMFKKMSPGLHVLTIGADLPWGGSFLNTFNLTVE